MTAIFWRKAGDTGGPWQFYQRCEDDAAAVETVRELRDLGHEAVIRSDDGSPVQSEAGEGTK